MGDKGSKEGVRETKDKNDEFSRILNNSGIVEFKWLKKVRRGRILS